MGVVGATEVFFSVIVCIVEVVKIVIYMHVYVESNGFFMLFSDGEWLIGVYAFGFEVGEWLQ